MNRVLYILLVKSEVRFTTTLYSLSLLLTSAITESVSGDSNSEASLDLESGSDKAEPVRKQLRQRNTADHQKNGISQAWTKEFKWLEKVCVASEW